MRKLAYFMAAVLTITSVPWPGGPVVPGVITAQASLDKGEATLASGSDADMEEEEIEEEFEDEEPLASDSDADKPGGEETDNTYDVPGTNAVLTFEIGDDDCITITNCNEDAEGKLEIPAEIDGVDVTVIGDRAFGSCDSLTEVVLPDGIISIEDSAFSSCNNLRKVVLPDGIISIGSFAFSGNDGLTEIWLPDSITSIGIYAFLECDGLTKVRMPGGTTSIGEAAFRRCDNLKEIIWPDNITSTSIGKSVFSYCPGLTEVILPDGIISIGDYAFDMCRNLKKVVLPDSITSIGRYAFSTCSSLTEITLPNNITHISYGVFYSCGKLAEIKIPDCVTSIESAAFVNCDSLTEITLPDGITSIGSSAFRGCVGLAEIRISDGVTSMGSSAFSGCTSLTEIRIPDGVTSIESSLFSGCTSLTEIRIPDRVTSIGEGAFSDCTSLTEIRIPGGVTRIGSSAFSGCKNLTEIEIPYRVTRIESSLFSGCTSLAEITIPNGITIIESSAFSGCKSLTEIILPSSITTIEKAAFQNCDSLTKITIPNRITRIEDNLFNSCDNLTEITLPASITRIRDNAFESCTSLLDVYYAGSRTDWKRISIGSGNLFLTDAVIHYAKGDISYDFNRYIYQSDILNDLTIPSSAEVHDTLDRNTVSEQYINDLQNNGFNWATGLWEACDLISSALDDPTKLGDFAAEPKDIYMAIIMDTLETSVDMDSVIDTECEKMIGAQKKYVSTIRSSMRELYNIDVLSASDYKNLNYDQKKKLSELTEDFFKDDFAVLESADKVLSGVSKGINAVSNIEDFYEHCVSMTMAANLSDSVKEVVKNAYEQSKSMGNPHLESALRECVDIIESSQEELVEKMVNEGVTAIGVNAFKYVFKELFWKHINKTVKVVHPAVAVIQAAHKYGKYIADFAFNTSRITEQYGTMLGTYWVEAAFSRAYNSMQRIYLNSGSQEDAVNYLSALELIFKMRDQDCVEAWKFVDAVDHDGSWINDLFGNAEDIAEAKRSIEAIQKQYYLTYESAQTMWIHYLPDDYPGSGLYELYEPLFDESRGRILSKKWVSACPVDVYVYDSEDQLVASVVGNKVFCEGDLTIALDGDVKTLCFYENSDDYYIRYVGNDSGSMDITVTEYQEGAEERTANFYDIPLKSGKTYEADPMASDYTLIEEDGNEIPSDYDSSATDEATYTVSIQAGSMLQSGELFLTTKARAGETIDIQAYIPEGGTFIEWEASNGENIFENKKDMITTFRMPAEDIVIHAVTDQSRQILCTITFDSQGGDAVEAVYVPLNSSAGEMKKPSREGYEFMGWYTEQNGQGVQVTADTLISGDMTLYAFWKQGEPDLPDKVISISLQKPSQDIYVGDSVPLTVTISPETAVDKTVVWSTSDSTIAVVSSEGVLTALKEGEVTISVSLPDGSLKQSIVLDILKKDDGSGDDSSEEGGDDIPGGDSSEGEDSSGGSGDDSSSGGSSSGGGGSSGGGSSSSGSSSVAGPGAPSGTVSTDPQKGKVNSITGIVTGEAAGQSRWIQDTHGWKLLYADGTYAAGAMLQDTLGQPYEQISWELINGAWFAFGADQYLKTGFVYDHALAGWFYVDVNAGIKTGWVKIDQLWYYFNTEADGTRGKMFCSRKSPDGYYLKEDGSWDGNLPS